MKTTRTLLWEFLLDLLNRNGNESIIKWTKKSSNEFKLVDPQTVAYHWGALKNRPSMNMDKMTRSLRFYYAKGIISKVPNTTFTYRFGNIPELKLHKRVKKTTKLTQIDNYHGSFNASNDSMFCSSPQITEPIKRAPVYSSNQYNNSYTDSIMDESHVHSYLIYSSDDSFDKRPDYSIYSSIFETNPSLTSSHLQYQTKFF